MRQTIPPPRPRGYPSGPVNHSATQREEKPQPLRAQRNPRGRQSPSSSDASVELGTINDSAWRDWICNGELSLFVSPGARVSNCKRHRGAVNFHPGVPSRQRSPANGRPHPPPERNAGAYLRPRWSYQRNGDWGVTAERRLGVRWGRRALGCVERVSECTGKTGQRQGWMHQWMDGWPVERRVVTRGKQGGKVARSLALWLFVRPDEHRGPEL